MPNPSGWQQHKSGWIMLALGIAGMVVGLVGGLPAVVALLPQQTPDSVPEVGLLSADALSTDLLDAPILAATATPAIPPTPVYIVVHISGAVAQPDVYAMPPDARVADVVRAAGGLMPDADSEHINLAEHIQDSQHIHVPRIVERGTSENNPAPFSTDAPPSRSQLGNGLAKQINLNTASLAELDTLPNIGKVTAQRILDYRTTNGAFTSVDDLQQIEDIGPALIEGIRPLVHVE